MLIRTIPVLFVLLLSSVASAEASPDTFDLPEVGVRFTDYPTDLFRPRTSQRPAGSEAIVQVDFATLTIIRDRDPLPPEQTVSDPAFEQRLLNQQKKTERQVEKSQLTRIGGQDAWLMEGSYTVGPTTAVYSDAYVIFDHHLVRISARAIGLPKTSPDFQKASKLMTTISFEPAIQPPAPPPSISAAIDKVPMPPFVPGPAGMFYPPGAQRKSQQGIVDVSFTIDAEGHVQNLTTDFVEYDALARNIPSYLQYGTFRIPSDWASSGNTEHRFQVEFQFKLTDSQETCARELPTHTPGAKVMRICGVPIL
jgi:outer membrane biosynthesis protein TonB